MFPDLQISVQPRWKLPTSCATGDFFKHIPTHVYRKLPSFFQPTVSLEIQAKNIGMESSRLSQWFHCDHVSPIASRRLSLRLLPVKPSFNGALEKCWEMPFFSLKTKTFEKNKQQISLCFLSAKKQLEHKLNNNYMSSQPSVVVNVWNKNRATNLSPFVKFPCSWLHICCHPLFLCLGQRPFRSIYMPSQKG